MSNFSRGQGKQGVRRRCTNVTSHNQPRSLTQRLRKRAISEWKQAKGLRRIQTSKYEINEICCWSWGSPFKPVTITSELLQRHLNPAEHGGTSRSRWLLLTWCSVPFLWRLEISYRGALKLRYHVSDSLEKRSP